MTDNDWQKQIKRSVGQEKVEARRAYSDWLEEQGKRTEAAMQRAKAGLSRLEWEVSWVRPYGEGSIAVKRFRTLAGARFRVSRNYPHIKVDFLIKLFEMRIEEIATFTADTLPKK